MQKTHAQIDTNRRNTTKSAGQKDQHYLITGTKNFVLQTESTGAWKALLNNCIGRFQPADELELDLVVEIAFARLRLRRVWAIETSMFDTKMDRQAAELGKRFRESDGETRLATAFNSLGQYGAGLNTLTRYENRIRRNFERAMRDLEKLQEQRRQREAEAEELQNEPETLAPESVTGKNEPEPAPQTLAKLQNEPKLVILPAPEPPQKPDSQP